MWSDARPSQKARFAPAARGAPSARRASARRRALSCALGLFAAGCAAPPAREPSRDVTLRVSARESAAFEAEYGALIDRLMPGMAADAIPDRAAPQRELEEACFRAGRPGAEAERVGLCRAMLRRTGPRTPQPARLWLLRQLERLGSRESVDGLARLLADRDPLVREAARRALQNNVSPRAGDALRRALARARDRDARIALIHALGARGEAQSVRPLVAATRDADVEVAAAAVAALADIGTDAAVDALDGLWRASDSALREEAAVGVLRCAQRLAAGGGAPRAARLALDVYRATVPQPLRAAALVVHANAAGVDALPRLLDVIRGRADADLAPLAVRLAAELPGAEVTAALCDEVPEADPPTRGLLLGALADRGDAAALTVIRPCVGDPDPDVGAAALRALGALGGAADVPLLARAASDGDRARRGAARAALARLRGRDVDDHLSGLLSGAEPPIRAEALRALGARHYPDVVAVLLGALADEAGVVRIAALELLGRLAQPEHLGELLRAATSATDDEVRRAAEDAIVATAGRIADPQQRADPILPWLTETGEPLDAARAAAARATVVRILGRVGGDRALEALRAALEDPDEGVYEAAARALCAWPDARVLDDLDDLMRNAPSAVLRVLALRGYIRLVRLPSERDGLATLEMLRYAMGLAGEPAEKKQALAGVGEINHVEALRTAEAYLGDAALRDEAAAAVLGVARSLACTDYDDAVAALARLEALELPERLRRQIGDAREAIERFRGYIVCWQISGPYPLDAARFEDLLETPLPPEQPDGGGAAWRDLRVTNPREPWTFDLASAVGGTNRCVFVRTVVWSDTSQEATLEIGTDDGVKAWLNGELVHTRNVVRGLAIGHDRVRVRLGAGANLLMLKISQGAGAWGFAVGVKSVDGGNLSGLRFALPAAAADES